MGQQWIAKRGVAKIGRGRVSKDRGHGADTYAHVWVVERQGAFKVVVGR